MIRLGAMVLLMFALCGQAYASVAMPPMLPAASVPEPSGMPAEHCHDGMTADAGDELLPCCQTSACHCPSGCTSAALPMALAVTAPIGPAVLRVSAPLPISSLLPQAPRLRPPIRSAS
ncbi:hypothetical protein RM530_01095 [Algiphilus sp. W345]|uniref:CopL family metal-binding regulatory protein n=1 Tax=Banduia mediterranea TaxID=3075609 RepID=A0ABU2WDK2_9GAMM|nr:hypothetical protein [Algiphilus sp. W345]MDT0495963.1 hypothetical protein [Algiphilus sp. W345]